MTEKKNFSKSTISKTSNIMDKYFLQNNNNVAKKIINV